MPSKVDVANTALDRLGQPPVVSFSDGTKTANLVNRLWPIVRDQVHRMGCWRRLKARVELAADTTAPEFDYAYRFRLPAECLMIFDIFINSNPLNSRWELEGEYILSDEAGPLQLRYLKANDDPNQWDALHVSAVAWLLAAEMCESLNQSTEKRAQSFAAFEAVLDTARKYSGAEGNPVSLNAPDSWEAVRYGAGVADPRQIRITGI